MAEPLSYTERHLMIDKCLTESAYSPKNFVNSQSQAL
jgi:hypothetical protein